MYKLMHNCRHGAPTMGSRPIDQIRAGETNMAFNNVTYRKKITLQRLLAHSNQSK